MSKSLLFHEAFYFRQGNAFGTNGGVLGRISDGMNAIGFFKGGNGMNVRRMLRRLAIGLVALLLVAAVGAGMLWWSLRPDDVDAASPVEPIGPVSPVERVIDSGSLMGIRDRDILVFKGIPYAAPPVDELRWRAPQLPAAWMGVRDATKFGNDCWQNRPSWDPARSTQPMSEDCLTVNVWAPAEVPQGGAPVLFWIHGGGFVQGSSSQPALDGSAFARRGIILVSFNYRLGRFGFFAHPALMGEAGDHAVGNWGMMDQVSALRWLNRNIKAFGGNPEQVTLFGQSAGGASVAQLMLDPEVRNLFSAAIIQSSGGRNRWLPLISKDKSSPSGLGAALGFAAKHKIDKDIGASLRSLPASTVLGDVSLTSLDTKTFSGPMIDGRLVRSDFVDGFIMEREADVPLIVGTTNRELSHLNFLARYGLRQWAKRELDSAMEAVRSAYGSSDAFDDNIVNDWGFVEPARTIAAKHSARGIPTWLYSFDYVSEAKRSEFDGAPHASDVAFIFGTLGREGIVPTAADQAAADQVRDYWIAFAQAGKPQPGGRILWPAYTAADDQMLRFTARGPLVDDVARDKALNAITAAMEARKPR